MTKRNRNTDPELIEAWTLDQLAKSIFFHRKLHEWQLLEVAQQIETVRGEELNWDELQISEQSWGKVIHRGIKPVIVFAHPHVLETVLGSTGYYRMLSMVSQKSMKRVGLNLEPYEAGKRLPNEEAANEIARHLNRVISRLVEADKVIDVREFDLWRGMAAGSQAQGSWQNAKGTTAEIAIREVVIQRLQRNGYISSEDASATRIELDQNRVIIFADEPDIALYQDDIPQVVIEVKGGIDQAGVLERVGAALKSLQRARLENPNSVTVLIMESVSLTERAREDISLSSKTVKHLYTTRDILEDEQKREQFFALLQI